MTCTTAPYYKPTGPPLKVTTVRRYRRGSRSSSENRMDDIPSELISNLVEGTVKALTYICQKIWEQKKCPTEWTSHPGSLRFLSGIPSASDRGVYSLLFCSIFTLRESHMIPSTNSTFQLVTGLSPASVLQMT